MTGNGPKKWAGEQKPRLVADYCGFFLESSFLIVSLQQTQLVESDIEKALASFQKNFKIPSSVLEAR